MSLLERLEKQRARKEEKRTANEEQPLPTEPDDNQAVGMDRLLGLPKKPTVDVFSEWKVKLHQRLVDVIFDNPEENDLEHSIRDVIVKENPPLSKNERERMVHELLAEARGYGPIDSLLHDDSVTEIMVNGPDHVYVERKGRLELTPIKFLNDAHIARIIEKIVSPLGRRIDEASPMVDARLPDGSRVNAIIPPLAVSGSTLTIRKFSKDPFQSGDLIRFGTLSSQIVEFLNACVTARLNILVSGGTGSGKTTTLNVLSSFIPETERVITIEDAAELQLRQEHVVTLETRPPNVEGKGAITVRELVKNSLRMRPDRIVVGEVRAGEALDMLQAMNTGHDGSLTTVHANSPRDSLRRLEVMVLMAGMDLPLRAIREQIASAIDIIVQQARLRDGSRRVTAISEVMGMEGDNILLQDLFVFEETGRNELGKIIGRHRPTGIVPSFIDKLKDKGFQVDYQWFQPGEAVWS